MSQWVEVTMKDVAQPKGLVGGPFGSNLVSRDYVETGIPVIRGQNLSSGRWVSLFDSVYVTEAKAERDLGGNQAEAGDLVYTQRGTLGQVAIMPPDAPTCVISQSQMRLRVDSSKADPAYVYYWSTSPAFRKAISDHAIVAGVPHINLGILGSLPLSLPPRAAQEAIAHVLGTLDDLIENNRRRVQVLEEMARAIYHEWFVQLRYPGHGKAPMIDSALGPIPDGWEVSTLSAIADITTGQSPKSEFYNEDGIGRPFHQGVADFGLHFPRTRKWCSVAGRSASDGDILVSVRAPVGRLNVADTDMTIGRGLASIRAKHGRQGLLLGHLREVFAEEDSMGNDGAIFKSLSKAELSSIAVLVPPDSVADAANEVLEENFAMIRALSRANRHLCAVRDLLLPKLVSGEVDVSQLDFDGLIEGQVA